MPGIDRALLPTAPFFGQAHSPAMGAAGGSSSRILDVCGGAKEAKAHSLERKSSRLRFICSEKNGSSEQAWAKLFHEWGPWINIAESPKDANRISCVVKEVLSGTHTHRHTHSLTLSHPLQCDVQNLAAPFLSSEIPLLLPVRCQGKACVVDVLDFLFICFIPEQSRKPMLSIPIFANIWKPGEEVSSCHYLHLDNRSDFLIFVVRNLKGEMVINTYWL